MVSYNIGTNFYLTMAQRGKYNKLEGKHIAFAISVKFDGPEQMVSEIPAEYRHRWGVET